MFSFDKAGLSLSRLKDVGVAQLCKWLWVFYKGENKLLWRVIMPKYGAELNGYYTKKVKQLMGAPHGKELWGGQRTFKICKIQGRLWL